MDKSVESSRKNLPTPRQTRIANEARGVADDRVHYRRFPAIDHDLAGWRRKDGDVGGRD